MVRELVRIEPGSQYATRYAAKPLDSLRAEGFQVSSFQRNAAALVNRDAHPVNSQQAAFISAAMEAVDVRRFPK
jgi:hypothetical protein